AEFYSEAAGKVESPELATLFRRMGEHKHEIVSGLSAEVAAIGGDPADHGTMVGSMRQASPKARPAVRDTSDAYAAQPPDLADRPLAAFKDTLQDEDTPAAARAAAQRFLPRVTECHDIMRNRKLAMKDAG